MKWDMKDTAHDLVTRVIEDGAVLELQGELVDLVWDELEGCEQGQAVIIFGDDEYDESWLDYLKKRLGYTLEIKNDQVYIFIAPEAMWER